MVGDVPRGSSSSVTWSTSRPRSSPRFDALQRRGARHRRVEGLILKAGAAGPFTWSHPLREGSDPASGDRPVLPGRRWHPHGRSVPTADDTFCPGGAGLMLTSDPPFPVIDGVSFIRDSRSDLDWYLQLRWPRTSSPPGPGDRAGGAGFDLPAPWGRAWARRPALVRRECSVDRPRGSTTSPGSSSARCSCRTGRGSCRCRSSAGRSS